MPLIPLIDLSWDSRTAQVRTQPVRQMSDGGVHSPGIVEESVETPGTTEKAFHVLGSLWASYMCYEQSVVWCSVFLPLCSGKWACHDILSGVR